MAEKEQTSTQEISKDSPMERLMRLQTLADTLLERINKLTVSSIEKEEKKDADK